MSSSVGSILIIDDEEGSRASLEALLELEGYHLLLAENAYLGLEMASQHLPDLILLDVMMPGMDGYEACTRLRADPKLAPIPILMITALDEANARLRGLQCGADDFINKPINRAELRARVNTVMRLNRYRRLVEERTKFEWIAEQTGDGYIITKPDDYIVYANPKALSYLQTDAVSCTKQTFLELAQAHYQCEPAAMWVAWPQNSSTLDNVRYLIYPESATTMPLWLDVQVLVIDGSERLLCLRDVTEQMETLRNMQTFHGMVQHKLRTPLEPMISGLSFLTESEKPLDPKLQAEFIHMALDGARQLNNEITQIFAYLNADKLIDPMMKISLSQMSADVERIAEQVGIQQCEVNFDGSLDNAMSDLGQQNLSWIITELLHNAKKFHPQQNPIVCVEFYKNPQPDRFSLRVTDNGLSLTPEQTARAWLPYYQGEKYFTGQSPGVGLGLSTIAMLIWQIGGTCTLYNRTPAPGVVVELCLPYEL